MQKATQNLRPYFLCNLRGDQRGPIIVLLAALKHFCWISIATLIHNNISGVQHLLEIVEAKIWIATALVSDHLNDVLVNFFECSVKLPFFVQLLPPHIAHFFRLFSVARV